MKKQYYTREFAGVPAEDLVRELEFRGYWSIPKVFVQQMHCVSQMDLSALRIDPKGVRHCCAREVADRMGHFLLDTHMIKFSEGKYDEFGATRELIGSVHVVTQMPRSLLPSTPLSVPLSEDGE